MAIFTASAAVDMDDPIYLDLTYDAVLTRTSSELALLWDTATNRVGTFTGNITYDANQNITGGTVTRYELRVNGVSQAIVTHPGASAVAIQGFISANDGVGLNSFIFSGSDQFTGSNQADDLWAYGAGGDRLFGLGGNDTLRGLAGDDLLNGGLGSDTLEGGTGGLDLANYGSTSQGVYVDFGFGYGHGVEIDYDYYDGIEGALGGGGSDTLYGADGFDVLDGQGGNDVIVGQAGNDVISGGSGDDIIVAGIGNDNVDAGAGADFIYGQDGNDTISGGEDNDYADGGSGQDIIDGGAGADRLHGGEGNDTVTGGAGEDMIGGSEGDDSVDGGEGHDIILGGTGADTLFGGTDHDWDRIQSQTEASAVVDIFVLNNPGDQAVGNYDQFENFEIGIDRIRVVGATGFGDIAYSDYPGQGVKIVNVQDGSAAFLYGIQQAEVQADWFIFG